MSNANWFDYYARLPIWAQNVACSFAGIRMRRERYNKVFHEFLSFLEEFQWKSSDEQEAYQDRQVVEIVRHAYQSVPYYRAVMDERKLRPEDFRGVADLPKLPLLTKEIVRQRYGDLISRAVPKSRHALGQTSGTTGTALKLVRDIDTIPKQWAVWWRHRQRFGIRLNHSYLHFGGRSIVPLSQRQPPFWRRNLPMRQTFISIQHMSRENMAPLVEYLQRRKVDFYAGYPSGLYLLAGYLLENNIRLKHPPRVTVSGAESLLPYQRQAIEKGLDTEMADQYGAGEYCGNISECEKHRYHIDMEFGAIELLPMERVPHSLRRIVCTGFQNPVMPLIRYEIGDLATLDDGRPCECGRQAPTVAMVDGRIESYIVTPDGRQLGRLDYLFKDTAQIREAQLLQDDVSRVTVKVVRRSNYSQEDEVQLTKDLRKYLGDEIAVAIEYVDEIPRGANGKFRQIVSSVFPDYCRPPTEGITET